MRTPRRFNRAEDPTSMELLVRAHNAADPYSGRGRALRADIRAAIFCDLRRAAEYDNRVALEEEEDSRLDAERLSREALRLRHPGAVATDD